LFITSPGSIVAAAYKELHEYDNKTIGGFTATRFYANANYGTAYYDYLGLLGTIAYLNSHEFFTDDPGSRTYPQWCQDPKVKTRIDTNISTLTGGQKPTLIYSTQINDTEDVVKTHKILAGLNAFEGMLEIPVFDVKKFHIKWQQLSEIPGESALVTSPFDSTGLPKVPLNGLKANAYPTLSNTYGDVFYQTILDTCVIQPTTSFVGKYAYSKVRIPVNALGVSGKAYGLRSGTIYTLGADPAQVATRQSSGSTGLSYSQIGVGASAIYLPVLAYLMYRNFGTGYQNQTWKTFD
jgi:hypothetical protein